MVRERRSGRLAILQAAAVEDARVGPAALRVLVGLSSYADRDGWAWPKQRTLAERLGISRQAVGRQLHKLAVYGYIAIEAQPTRASGARRALRYRVCFELVVPPEHSRPVQPQVAREEQPEVARRATPDVAREENVPLRSETQRTTHRELTTPGPSASGGERRSRRGRRNREIVDDVPAAVVAAELTAEDRARWEQAAERLRDAMSRGNWELLVDPLEPLGRTESGGLFLRAPRGQSIAQRIKTAAQRALVDAGEPTDAARLLTIVEGV